MLWKFKDDVYSGKSWSKPFIGKIREIQTDLSVIDRWVVILAGGMAFNNEDADENEGKAIFVVDASSGELIWMVGYNQNGAADNSVTADIDTLLDSGYTGPGVRYLTNKIDFNYPIPSSITPVDRDNDGFLDTIYFGNVAGHLFKADIASADTADWKTYQLFKKGLRNDPEAHRPAVDLGDRLHRRSRDHGGDPRRLRPARQRVPALHRRHGHHRCRQQQTADRQHDLARFFFGGGRSHHRPQLRSDLSSLPPYSSTPASTSGWPSGPATASARAPIPTRASSSPCATARRRSVPSPSRKPTSSSPTW